MILIISIYHLMNKLLLLDYLLCAVFMLTLWRKKKTGERKKEKKRKNITEYTIHTTGSFRSLLFRIFKFRTVLLTTELTVTKTYS